MTNISGIEGWGFEFWVLGFEFWRVVFFFLVSLLFLFMGLHSSLGMSGVCY